MKIINLAIKGAFITGVIATGAFFTGAAIGVLINKDKLLQVMHNIIDNSISIAENNSNILITLNRKKENFVEIKIYDQGKGIDLKDKNKIFDRFYTDRKNDRDQHSGLGLSISFEIISSFDGIIELTESDNLDFRGACFLIKLPLKSNHNHKRIE